MIGVLMAAAVFVACDGTLMVASPPAVWRQGDGAWEQVHGAAGERPATGGAERTSCAKAPVSTRPPVRSGTQRVGGSSRDHSLLWSAETGADASRFTARLWTGETYRKVLDER